MSLSIRSAKLQDAALICQFMHDLAVYEKLGHEAQAVQADIERDFFCPSPRVFCEIAEYNGRFVGFAVWFYSYSTFKGRHGIWLEDLFVDPKFRGKGIGKALLANLAQRCASENLGRFEWPVLNWNEPSIQFYKAHGAVLMDEWTVCRMDGDALLKLGSP